MNESKFYDAMAYMWGISNPFLPGYEAVLQNSTIYLYATIDFDTDEFFLKKKKRGERYLKYYCCDVAKNFMKCDRVVIHNCILRRSMLRPISC